MNPPSWSKLRDIAEGLAAIVEARMTDPCEHPVSTMGECHLCKGRALLVEFTRWKDFQEARKKASSARG